MMLSISPHNAARDSHDTCPTTTSRFKGDQILSANTAAARLLITREQLAYFTEEGEVPVSFIGNKPWYHLRDIEILEEEWYGNS